jgi:hypothetical protein
VRGRRTRRKQAETPAFESGKTAAFALPFCFFGTDLGVIGCVGALCINGLECSIRSAVDPKNIRGILTNDRSQISFLR